jgi:hypothetical protein
MLNVTQIPALRVPFIDPNTGLISREWYRFLLNLFTLTGSGNNQISLDDVQVGPPSFPALEFALSNVGLNSDTAPPPIPPQDIPDYFSLAPPSIGTGSVTSVSATVPSFLSVSGVPITTAGTIAITYSGTALPVANGGTGATSLTGAGIVTISDGQVITGQKSFTSPTNQFLGLTYATSDGASGSNAYFGEDSSYATLGGVNGVVLAYGSTYPGFAAYVADPISFRPYINATYSCGTGTQRWSTVCTINLDMSGAVTNGTWNGSVIGTAYGGTGSTSLTGAGIVTTTDGQVISGQKSFTSFTNQFRGITYATSDGGSGSNAYFGESSSYATIGGVNGVVLASGSTFPGTGRYVGDSVSFRPFSDASYSLGTGPQRWTAVYAVNGTIQTSDGNEKQQIEELSAAELAVAKRIKGLIRKFKFNDSVAEKGDGARIHVGVIAQDVHDAFVAEGLDPYKYGLFCSDTWTTLDGTSKTRLGVRYEELLAFVIAAL